MPLTNIVAWQLVVFVVDTKYLAKTTDLSQITAKLLLQCMFIIQLVYSHVNNTCTTTSFHFQGSFWTINVVCHPLFIDMPIPRFESKPSCIYVVRVSIVTLSMICILDFGTVLALTYFLFLILSHIFLK